MRSLALLGSRMVLGGYLAVHGAQKLFGAFEGPGLDGTAEGFEGMGLEPGRQMAALAGTCELTGGVLTATGFAYPLGPLTVASTMAVAASTHRENGALAAKGGFELPLTNLAAALALAAAGRGKIGIGPRLPAPVALLVALVGAGAAAVMVQRLLAEAQAEDTPTTVPGQAAGQPGSDGQEAPVTVGVSAG